MEHLANELLGREAVRLERAALVAGDGPALVLDDTLIVVTRSGPVIELLATQGGLAIVAVADEQPVWDGEVEDGERLVAVPFEGEDPFVGRITRVTTLQIGPDVLAGIGIGTDVDERWFEVHPDALVPSGPQLPALLAEIHGTVHEETRRA